MNEPVAGRVVSSAADAIMRERTFAVQRQSSRYMSPGGRWLTLLRAVLLVSLSALWHLGFAGEPDFHEIAPGVFVAIAPLEEASPENHGFISNLGFIVGPKGVVAIGTGASDAQGVAMLRAIRRVTAKPVRLALNLQATPDHVLGNTAFRRRGIPILAQRETDRFMVSNCPACIRNARSQVGARRLGKANLARPTRLVDTSRSLDVAGRQFNLLYFGPSFQPGSLALLDRETGVLFAGEAVSLDRIPETRTATPHNWIAALERIAAMDMRRLVPAHGPVADPQRALELVDYLRQLRGTVERAYNDGVPMQEAAEAAPVPAFAEWALYAVQHSRNVHFAYLRVEREDLSK